MVLAVLVLLAQTGAGDVAAVLPGWAVAVLAIVNVSGFVVMVRMLFSGKLALPREVEAEKTRADKAEAALTKERESHETTRAQTFSALTRDVMPALTRATVVMDNLRKGPDV